MLRGKTPSHNIFIATPGVTRRISSSISTPYCAWKMLIHESITKFTTEEVVRRGDEDFSLCFDECESFAGIRPLYDLLYFTVTRVTEFPFSMKQWHKTNLRKY